MVYSILLLISVCLKPAFGSNNTLLEKLFPSVSRTHAMPFSAASVVQTETSDIFLELPSDYRSQEGLVAKIDSVLSIAERAEGTKPYAVRRAREIFEKDELKIGLYYTPSECGLTLYDKTDIIYFLVNTPPKEVESHVSSLLAQCGKLSNHKNELRCLWIRSNDSINVILDYSQFLDDLRDEMLSYSKPVRRHSEPNKRVSFNLFPASVARQRTTSDQHGFLNSVRRRFSYQQGNNSAK